jgi:hypothetical protein
MPTVRLLAPRGVAQVGARGEPNPLAVVDSALLFRVSSSPASALVLDQTTSQLELWADVCFQRAGVSWRVIRG